MIGRKASLSNYNTTAATSRPGTRRRETSDSYVGTGPLSPAENKTFFRGDLNTATPPPALLRRRTDYKDEESTPTSKEELDPQDTPEAQAHFPGIRRAGTGPLSAGLNAPSASPWSAATQTGGFGSMGSFGSFAIGSAPAPNESADKRPGFGSARGGSRFKDLLSKASSEDIHQGLKDKSSFGALEKLPEEDARASQLGQRAIGFGTRPGRSETNPYEEAPDRTGSAVLGGSQDGQPNLANDNLAFSSHGPPSNAGAARDFGHDDHFQQTPYGRFNPHDPMSPTNTNPYQSPHARPDDDEQEPSEPSSQAPGSQPVGANRRNVFPGPDDRGLGSMRGTGGFGNIGFGSLGGPMWSGASAGPGKPALDRTIGSAFGDPIFSPLGDLQSPGGGLGGGFFGAGGFGSQGRASRLGAMFPPAMQEQMRGDSRNELHQGTLDSRPDSAQQHAQRDPFEPAGRRPEGFTGGSNRFDDSPPMRTADELVSQGQQNQFVPPQPSLPTPQAANQRASSGGDNFQAGHGLSQSSGSNSSNQMPAAQQRQMVMPDRMRWIYRDPQGNTQGPWSGLEMHDWFKAGFFTAELQVKKLEDTDYEPLAQLVRRIGNSREPFLVPQIGVPHGPPSGGQGNHWANPASSSTAQSGSTPGAGATQPPFASSFPSFGTTLTAEQQNALERRKQEEQFLMARQKEHLAQQQIAMKHLQYQNGLHSLQHQPSAHSLQSQPSFGSMTSPAAYQQSPMPAPIQPPQQQAPPLGQTGLGMGPSYGRDNEIHGMMDRLSFNQRTGAGPFPGGASGQAPSESGSSQHISSMLQDRARLQQQQHQHQQSEMRDHEDTFLGQQGRNDRLEEFRTLQREGEFQAGRLGPESPQQAPQPIGAQRRSEDPSSALISQKGASAAGITTSKLESESLSLAQQIQIAAASQQAAAEESAWARKDTYVEPPPVSISPLPAPAAQRNRLHVADALAAESRSETQTPIETPPVSVAPWAERTVEHPKGPSLKEIQEAEAKRAAEQEELVAAARRAQAEQEILLQAQAPAAAPGLPSSSTWGSSSSPVAASNTSVWAKQVSAKPATSNSKKTLAQIQREEESRKQRAAASAAAAAAAAAPSHSSPGGQTGSGPGSGPAGKRYAELASKAIPAVPLAPNSAWMTVGSGGKTKAPPAVVATPQPASRTASGSAATVAKPRPAISTSRSTAGTNQNKAGEEFSKWIKASLGKGLNSNINGE